MSPIAVAEPVRETAEQRFHRLLDTWHSQVSHLSSTSRRVSHPAYQEIIAMGRDAVPFLLREMECTKNGHLATALQTIIGIDPVAPDDHGKIAKIAETWVQWGKENGIRW